MRIALLASGALGFKLATYIYEHYTIQSIFCDAQSYSIIDFAKADSIPLFVGNPRNENAKQFIANNQVDLLLSVNYLFLIEKDLIQWPLVAAINFHGSLLPKYRGRTPHVWAIINNEEFTGVTAHLIDEKCDSGDILFQKAIPIAYDDTGASILEKFTNIYPKLVDEVISKLTSGEVLYQKQDHPKATYYGKRVPADGLINWDWHKERIRNWVRALAYPYPGAFTFYDNKKIFIDEIQYDDGGYDNDMINGTILSINPVVVKTPNGAIRVIKFREMTERIEAGGKFSCL